MSRKRLLKPGNKAPDSAQYEIVGSRGGKAGGKERTVVKFADYIVHLRLLKFAGASFGASAQGRFDRRV